MTPEETALVELAGMKCPRCAGEGIIPASVADLDPAFTCPDCHGSGYLLDASVRVPRCSQVGKKSHWHFGQHYPAKADCKQGWTPSPDLATWCWALKPYATDVSISLEGNGVAIGWRGEQPSWAADAEGVLAALARRP